MVNPETGPREPEELSLDDPETIQAEDKLKAVEQQTSEATERLNQKTAKAKENFATNFEVSKKKAQEETKQGIESAKNELAGKLGISREELNRKTVEAREKGESPLSEESKEKFYKNQEQESVVKNAPQSTARKVLEGFYQVIGLTPHSRRKLKESFGVEPKEDKK